MKYQPGFVPIQFYKLGRVCIILGILGIIVGALGYFFDWERIGIAVLYFCILLTLVGLYLRRFGPKEESE